MQGFLQDSKTPDQCNTRGPLSKLDRTTPQRKINVTSKSAVGDNQLSHCEWQITATLGHSQKAECMVIASRAWRPNFTTRSSMCVTGALFNHFQQSPGSSRSDICKILCRPKWTWVRGGLQGMIELCPRLFPSFWSLCCLFSQWFLCFPKCI